MVGWPVWLSLAIGAAGALATAGRRFPTQAVQLRLGVLLPLITFSFCLLTRSKSWLGFFYKCYYAQLDVAFIISFAFGVAFTLGALRARHWFSRVCGGCYVPAYAWLFIEAFRYTERMHHWWE
jgi:hypothetical protein